MDLSLKKKRKPKKDVYKPIKIYSEFDDSYIEYKSDSKKGKSISIAGYLYNIKEHLRKLIDDKENGEWKIQLIMKINFISFRNFIEGRDMYSKSDNFEIMMEGNTNEIIRNLFNSLLRNVIHWLHIAHLMKKIINWIIIEVKIV